jgi:endonuclease G
LKASDIGKEQRGDFHPDDDLPAGFRKITPTDYTRSGFDRGHMCNSKDRTDTREDDDATFLMTNMLPQTPDLNRGPWEKFESYCRSIVKTNDLYIIAGGYGSRGTIANGRVNVPANCWKLIVVLPQGATDPGVVSSSARVIAIDMPNVEGIKQDDWRKYETTVRAIERATGYDLFSTLPKDLRSSLEAKGTE